MLKRPRLWLLLTMLAIASLNLVRFSPAAGADRVTLIGPISYELNVDSGNFVWDALTFPKGLATELGKIRRERPLYPALGWLASRALTPLRPLVPGWLVEKVAARFERSVVREAWLGVDPREAVIAFGAMILVSLSLYWLGLCLVYTVLRLSFEPQVAFLLALVPATHFDAVASYLVPHTECFNLLVPALFLWALLSWSRRESGRWPAAVIGLCSLGKGLPFVFANWLFEFAYVRRQRSMGLVSSLGLAAGLMALPGLLYVVLLKAVSVPLYSAAMAPPYRQFVWILDYVEEGRVVAALSRLMAGVQQHGAQTAAAFFVPVCAICVLLLLPRVREFSIGLSLRLHLVVYTASCAAFWALCGFVVPRLTSTQFPAITYALGTLAVSRCKRPTRTLAIVIGLVVFSRLLGIFDAPLV